MAPNYVMGLDSSPACCTSLLLTSSFSTILFLYLPLLVHLCAQIFSISYCYPTPSFFPALTFFPLFLFIAPLFYNFLPRLYFCHFLSLFSPISTTCLSFSSRPDLGYSHCDGRNVGCPALTCKPTSASVCITSPRPYFPILQAVILVPISKIGASHPTYDGRIPQSYKPNSIDSGNSEVLEP